MSKSDLERAFTVPRDPETISKEYAGICRMSGDKAYRIEVLKAEISQLNDRLFELNKEHAASQKMSGEKVKEQTEQVLVPEAANEVTA